MAEETKLSIFAPIMQSFTSIGPMLDMVAIFSVIAIYSGAALPIVMLLAFLIGYSTINTTYRLSSRFVTNGGYYSYAGIVLGKNAGIFVAFLYLGYAMMVLPNISLFFGGFVAAVLQGFVTVSPMMELVASFAFTILVIAMVSQGLRLTFKYTIIAGVLEFVVLALSTGLFFTHSTASIGIINGSMDNPDGIWLGLIFGVVAFAGSGSSIFFSDNVKKPSSSIPSSILFAYTVSGLIMVLASLSLVLFLGGSDVLQYSLNPYFLLAHIQSRLGNAFYILFVSFAMVSAANLSISYMNALKNGFSRMLSENLFGIKARQRFKQSHLLLLVMLISFSVEIVSYITNSFFYVFSAMVGAVGLSYITVHLITNGVIIKIRKSFKSFSSAILLPVISSAILLVSFYYAALVPQFSFLWTNLLYVAILAIAAIAVLIIRTDPERYDNIMIESTRNMGSGAIDSGEETV